MEQKDFYKNKQIFMLNLGRRQDRVRASAEDIYDSLINPDFYIKELRCSQSYFGTTVDIIDGLGGMSGVLATTVSTDEYMVIRLRKE